jgi:hypothetical protein
MSIASRIAAASRKEIESPAGSGLYWRVQRVNSGDLLKSRFAGLRMVAPASNEHDHEEAARKVLRASDRDLETAANSTSAVVCAGVTHARFPDGEWEPIRITSVLAERDHENGVLHLQDLPGGVDTDLYQAIVACHGDAKEAAERLATFRIGA